MSSRPAAFGRGTPWGHAGGAAPPGTPVAGDDAAAAALLAPWAPGEAPPTASAPHTPPTRLVLTGGDLWRAVGGPSVAGRWESPDAQHLPVDAIAFRLDGAPWRCAIASLVARTRFARRCVVVCNSPIVDGRQVAPRAHPGDGLLDVLDARLPPAELVKVLRRARLGAHLPHPGITMTRGEGGERDGPFLVCADGMRAGRAHHVEWRVLACAAVVIV